MDFNTIKPYAYGSTVSALAVTLGKFVAQYAPSKYNYFTATYKTAALIAFCADTGAKLIAEGTAKYAYKPAAGMLTHVRDAVTIGMSTGAIVLLNNRLADSLKGRLSSVNRNGALAIGVTVIAARFLFKCASDFCTHNSNSKK